MNQQKHFDPRLSSLQDALILVWWHQTSSHSWVLTRNIPGCQEVVTKTQLVQTSAIFSMTRDKTWHDFKLKHPGTKNNNEPGKPFVPTSVGLPAPSGFVHRACCGSKNRVPNPQPIAARTTWHLLPKLHRRWSKSEWWNNIGLSSET